MLWIAITFPLLPLEAALPVTAKLNRRYGQSRRRNVAGSEQRTDDADSAAARCYALADHSCILLPDLDAFQCGVLRGHARSHAFALAPGLVLVAPDPAREKAVFESIALAMLAYTPTVSLATEHTLLLEVQSSLRLFGGLRALLTRIREAVAAFSCVACIGCAPTAWGAWLLARARANRKGGNWCVPMQERLAEALDALPVSLLPETALYGDVFEQLGCDTLAKLRSLPRAGVVRRFGDDILQWLARAYGEQPDPRESFQPPRTFHVQLELPSRVDTAEGLLFAARRLIAQLAGWLNAQHAAVCAYTLVFEHEPAFRHAPRTSILTVAWTVPSRDADHLNWLLREKLDQTELVAPVLVLGLTVEDVVEYEEKSASLFPMPESERDSMARLLERLRARLGTENVRQLSPYADHRPESAMCVDTGVEGEKRIKAAAPKNARPLSASPAPFAGALPNQPRPSWMLEHPLKLLMRNQRPFYRSPLTMLTRTERIEAGWWDGNGVKRDYYVATDDRGQMFWIYRERHGGAWFLQGFFG